MNALAERRMFSKKIINTAKFLKMPLSAQCLYFHLGLNADDDGVVEAYTVLTLIKATEDDLKILVTKGFITVLNEDLVSFVNDWTENNKLRSDRKVNSVYTNLLLQVVPDVVLLDKKQRSDRVKKKWDVPGTSLGRQWDGIGEDSIDKYSKEEEKKEREKEYKEKEKKFSQTCEQIVNYLNSVLSSQYKANNKQTQQLIKERIDEGFTFNDFKAVIDKKNKEWRNTEMAEFLRPSTLFGNNFENYLNTPAKNAHSQNTGLRAHERNYNQNDYDALITNISDIKF